jgi:hypothetical protein
MQDEQGQPAERLERNCADLNIANLKNYQNLITAISYYA